MLFVSFTKGLGGFPYVLIITCEVPTLIPVDGITLGDHGVFVLRLHFSHPLGSGHAQ